MLTRTPHDVHRGVSCGVRLTRAPALTLITDAGSRDGDLPRTRAWDGALPRRTPVLAPRCTRAGVLRLSSTSFTCAFVAEIPRAWSLAINAFLPRCGLARTTSAMASMSWRAAAGSLEG